MQNDVNTTMVIFTDNTATAESSGDLPKLTACLCRPRLDLANTCSCCLVQSHSLVSYITMECCLVFTVIGTCMLLVIRYVMCVRVVPACMLWRLWSCTVLTCLSALDTHFICGHVQKM